MRGFLAFLCVAIVMLSVSFVEAGGPFNGRGNRGNGFNARFNGNFNHGHNGGFNARFFNPNFNARFFNRNFNGNFNHGHGGNFNGAFFFPQAVPVPVYNYQPQGGFFNNGFNGFAAPCQNGANGFFGNGFNGYGGGSSFSFGFGY